MKDDIKNMKNKIMQNCFFVIMVCACLAGCVATSTDLASEEINRREQAISSAEISRRFVSLRLIKEGMTKNEVQTVLSNKVIVGYELTSPEIKQYKPLTVDNPYKKEVFKKGASEYSIDYYLVGIKNQDGEVTDDELVPLVFHKDKLIGSGWTFLNSKIKNN